MQQKHYIDIERVKEASELTSSNMGGFVVGDDIVIQCKMDGANASITLDECGNIVAFSRKRELNYSMTLNGFWNYAQSLNKSAFDNRYIVFGEWLIKHTVSYAPEAYGKWYVFDIWDRMCEQWVPYPVVKRWCEENGFTCVMTWYHGPFVSWEHVRGFLARMNLATEQEEGIVVKNQTRLNIYNPYEPFVLKIVNDSFSEIKKDNHRKKVEDPQLVAERQQASECADMVVTKRRVHKVLMALIDDGVLPSVIEPKNMGAVAKVLPSAVYKDCVKEEPEIVASGGEYFGKACNAKVMAFAREIILGGAI